MEKTADADQVPATGPNATERKKKKFGCTARIGFIILLFALNGLLGIKALIGFIGFLVAYWVIAKPWLAARKAAQESSVIRRGFGWTIEDAFGSFCRAVTYCSALVVIALIACFSASLYPSAAYMAQAVPVIHNLRTKAELFRRDKAHLPGMGRNADGSLAQTSQLADGLSGVQTFFCTNVAAYAVYTVDFDTVVAVTNKNHVCCEIDVGYADLTGQKARPKHFQYRVDACQGDSYLYVLGAFGDGDGLMARRGYAVLEFNNVAARVRAVATWTRYKPLAKKPKQIVMVSAEEARKYFKCETPEQAAKMNLCWVGDTDALMSGDKARIEKALEELKKAGWELR